LKSFLRAAGYAAASMVAVFGTVYAGPSLAWETNPGPAISYLDHAAATMAAVDLPLNDVQQTVPAAPAAVFAHEQTAPADIAADVDLPPRSLADLVGDFASAEVTDAEHECLAGAVYFEAKGEPLKGQLSVAEVILNRARSGRFPTTLCGVVKQRGQFSFIRAGRFPPIARASAAWRKAVAIAHIARQDLADGPAPRALFFHARYVAPAWRGLTRVAAVGNHIFYR
jgi:spore germination cell wall hydrolase CwlJ-like protein